LIASYSRFAMDVDLETLKKMGWAKTIAQAKGNYEPGQVMNNMDKVVSTFCEKNEIRNDPMEMFNREDTQPLTPKEFDKIVKG